MTTVPDTLSSVYDTYIESVGPRYQGGVQAIFRFPNGWGASVIEGPGAYGVELAVLDVSDSIHYGNPVTGENGVVGWLDRPRLLEALETVRLFDAESSDTPNRVV